MKILNHKKRHVHFRNMLVCETPHGRGMCITGDQPQNTFLCRINGPLVEFIPGEKKISSFLQVGINRYMETRYPFYLFNHSCEPNCGINEKLELVTIRPVKKGEELCWDYSTSMLECGWKMNCTCGKPSCRKIIEDFDLLSVDLQKFYFEHKVVMLFIRQHIENRRISKTADEIMA